MVCSHHNARSFLESKEHKLCRVQSRDHIQGCVGARYSPRNAADCFVISCGPIQGVSPVGSTPTHGQSEGWSSGDRRGSEQRVSGRPGSGSEFSGHALKAHGVERDGREADRGRPPSLSVKFEHISIVSEL